MAIDDLITMQPNLPPEVTEDLAELSSPPARLSILGTTKNIGRLADFPPIEAIWVGDVNQRQFDAILPLLDPVYLAFNGLRVADLAPLGRLQRLEALEINWNTKVTDISFLARLTGLRLLSLIHCTKVHDLAPIGHLRNLEILDLGGGMWATFKPDTLEPLRSLEKLRGLSLKAIRVGDESLAPVAGLTTLTEIELSNQFPAEEYARLSVAFPEIDCPHFKPYLDFGAGARANQVMITGKRGPVLTLPEDARRLERYVKRFRDMQEKFQGGG
ncbi:MAG: leucine-rich repeat domain-containing protein [Alphaproteobacteria bacterium]|nr:leucine-rich repeat domain-containing protein [Alphaproteobacteria bacterium]